MNALDALDVLIEQLNYDRWAAARRLEVLHAYEDQRRTPEQQAAFDDAVNILAHVEAARVVWLDRMEGVATSVAVFPRTDLAGAASLMEQADARFGAFRERLADGSLGRAVEYTTSEGQRRVSTVSQILSHLVTHGAYHGGQIA